jgi:hypothetical protein
MKLFSKLFKQTGYFKLETEQIKQTRTKVDFSLINDAN